MYKGKYLLLKNLITVCDYDFILRRIKTSITKKTALYITPIASQTLVKAYYNDDLKQILKHYDYIVVDSIWVKRTIAFLYNCSIPYRVRGVELMEKILDLSSQKKYRIFLYGNTKETLGKLIQVNDRKKTKAEIVGAVPSTFKQPSFKEIKSLHQRILKSKADIVLIGLGSPLQERFIYDYFKTVRVNKVVIAMGAAFDFIAGTKPQAPKWMQEAGVEWFYRLIHEPKRLWKRYLLLGPLFLILVLQQKMKILLHSRNRVSKEGIVGR